MTHEELRAQLARLHGETVESFGTIAWCGDDEDLKELHILFASGARLRLTAEHFVAPIQSSIVPLVVPAEEASA